MIASGFIHSPDVLIFDEPLTGLDPHGIRRMKESIVKRSADGASVILSSHLLHLVEELSDTVAIIQHGTQLAHGTIDNLKWKIALRRRDLLLYKIIRAQPQALGSAIAFFIFGWRRSWLIGTWAALSVLGIYFTFVALARARLKLMHIGFIARMLIISVVLTSLVSL